MCPSVGCTHSSPILFISLQYLQWKKQNQTGFILTWRRNNLNYHFGNNWEQRPLIQDKLPLLSARQLPLYSSFWLTYRIQACLTIFLKTPMQQEVQNNVELTSCLPVTKQGPCTLSWSISGISGFFVSMYCKPAHLQKSGLNKSKSSNKGITYHIKWLPR